MWSKIPINLLCNRFITLKGFSWFACLPFSTLSTSREHSSSIVSQLTRGTHPNGKKLQILDSIGGTLDFKIP